MLTWHKASYIDVMWLFLRTYFHNHTEIDEFTEYEMRDPGGSLHSVILQMRKQIPRGMKELARNFPVN